MRRNSKGQFMSNDDMSIHLPGFIGIYKISIVAILIFPWYVILINRNFLGHYLGIY